MNEIASTKVKFYRHSGKAPLSGLIRIGVSGFIIVPILGIIYGYLQTYNPLKPLNLLIAFGYVLIIGIVLSQAAKTGKIRNMYILGVAGFLFGLLAEYIGWVSWIAAQGGHIEYLLLFFSPKELLQIVQEIAREGSWSFRNISPTGTFPIGDYPYLIWLTEASGVIGGITYITVDMLAKIPFCEDSDIWTKIRNIGTFAQVQNIARFKNELSQGNFKPLTEMGLYHHASLTYTSVYVYECDQCRNFFILNVENVSITPNWKGKDEKKVKPVISNLMITSTVLDGLRKSAERRDENDKAGGHLNR